MLDDARPPVDVKQRCNPTALNLLRSSFLQYSYKGRTKHIFRSFFFFFSQPKHLSKQYTFE